MLFNYINDSNFKMTSAPMIKRYEKLAKGLKEYIPSRSNMKNLL